MPASTDFLPFATQAGANVESQSSYVSDPAVPIGFETGVAESARCNKVWRQSSFISSGVAWFTANILGINVADDGNLTNFITNFTNAVKQAAISVCGTVLSVELASPNGSITISGTNPITVDGTIDVEVTAGLVPVPGDLKWSAVNGDQTGWYVADGRAINNTDDPALFALFGANIPDLRDRFLRAAGGTSLDPGRIFGSFQDDAMQGHNHYNGDGVTSGSPFPFVYGYTNNDMPGDTANTMHTDNNTATAQGLTSGPKNDGTNGVPRVAAETRPTNYAACLLIKR